MLVLCVCVGGGGSVYICMHVYAHAYAYACACTFIVYVHVACGMYMCEGGEMGVIGCVFMLTTCFRQALESSANRCFTRSSKSLNPCHHAVLQNRFRGLHIV